MILQAIALFGCGSCFGAAFLVYLLAALGT
jgi:hypothetical protein